MVLVLFLISIVIGVLAVFSQEIVLLQGLGSHVAKVLQLAYLRTAMPSRVVNYAVVVPSKAHELDIGRIETIGVRFAGQTTPGRTLCKTEL